MRVIVLAVTLLVFASIVARAGQEYRPPRLADGHVDLQGNWLDTNLTPLERPPEFKTLLITSEEASRYRAQFVARAEDRSKPGEPSEFQDVRQIEAIRGEYRSSVIIDPMDGLIPGNDEFKKSVAILRANVLTSFDGPEDRPTDERCLLDLGSPFIRSHPVNNLHQIIQTANTIAIHSEEKHGTRLIRMNTMHAPAAVQSWSGDSVGWWEGDTLVVETKYFSAASSERLTPANFVLVSPQTVVVERFSRTAPDEIQYRFTVNDPSYFTRSWTGETRLHRTDERIYEVSCHEGNYSLQFMLEAARAHDKGELQ